MLEELGMKGVINATGCLTVLGGSVLDDEVLDAIREASKVYLDMPRLHEKVGAFIAGLTGAEDAYVTSGGAAGLALAAGACITRGNTGAMSKLPRTAGMRNEIIVQKQHRNQYDNALEIAGAKIVEIGSDEGCSVEELKGAISEETCAVFYFAYDPQPGVLPLEDVIKEAGERQIPVAVDAAAELPPPDNLRKYLRMGADIVVFSGGKDIGAPNDTGVILGRRDIVSTCRRLGPHSYEIAGTRTRTYLGRPMKTSKEDILAFAVALRRYLQNTDHSRRMVGWEMKADLLLAALSTTRYPARKLVPEFDVRQPRPIIVPRVEIETHGMPKQAQEIVAELRAGEPQIFAYFIGEHLYINPHCLRDGEEDIVASRLKKILA
ncbi:MAG: aminotransferase class V-fold PLP-dependent enzyme [Thaumarchaeota archaeon]|nr:aminotransferase class V-fold PLP-dependent enzyme [Nitrososphaerota archaeon]